MIQKNNQGVIPFIFPQIPVYMVVSSKHWKTLIHIVLLTQQKQSPYLSC